MTDWTIVDSWTGRPVTVSRYRRRRHAARALGFFRLWAAKGGQVAEDDRIRAHDLEVRRA